MDPMTFSSCTLPTAERPLRLAEFDDLFRTSVRSVGRDGDTVHLRLSGPAGLREQVRDLAERESECCSFFTFTLAGTDDDLELGIGVPAAHRVVLDALTVRAVELSA
jgi:hypothetical protein